MEPTKSHASDKPSSSSNGNTNPKTDGKSTQSTAHVATELASDLAGDAKDLASKVVDQAKDFVGDQVGDRREKSAGQIDKVAEALHRTSEDLGDTTAAPYVERAAAALDRVSGSVRNATFSGVISATERFARRDPVLFMGSAFAIGFLAARFLKSSATRAPQLLLTARSEGEQSARRGPRSGRQAPRGQRGRDGTR